MLTAVKLHRQLGLSAGEIEDVVSDDVLPREAGLVVADKMPDLALVQRGAGAQLAGEAGEMQRNPRHRGMLHREKRGGKMRTVFRLRRTHP